MGRQKRNAGIVEQIDGGVAELIADDGRPGRWTLLVDGYPQSAVDLEDPRVLDFEYMRRLASIVDGTAPAGTPLSVLHLGGGALTMARYIAVTRPGSAQRVVEVDAALIDLVRRTLPLPRNADIRVRAMDARAAVESMAASMSARRFDLIIADVYRGARVPAHLASLEFLTAAAKLLRPTGVYTANLADGTGLAFARGQVATLRQLYPDVCLLAEPSVLRGRRFGNVILAASAVPLPVDGFARAGAADAFPARLVHGDDLVRLVAGARVVTDAIATESPAPPKGIF